MNIKTTTIVTAKFGFLLLVLALLIAHGTDNKPVVTTGQNDPCARYTSSSTVYCVDDTDTQQDIAQLDGLTNLNGQLIIYNTNLQSLDFLSKIENINGTLTIAENAELVQISSTSGLQYAKNLQILSNPKLSDLSGLANITMVNGKTEIYNNSALTSLSAFSIGTDADTVSISSNPNLQDLRALDTLQTVQKNLSISGNGLSDLTELSSLTSVGGIQIGEQNITSLTGLGSLQTIGRSLSIINGTNLTSFAGLNSGVTYSFLTLSSNPKIVSLDTLPLAPATMEAIILTNNTLLSSLSALANVSTMSKQLQIYNNPALQTLQGLESLTQVGWFVVITDNAALTSLAALANVQSVESLKLQRNTALTTLGMAALSRVETDFIIQDNTALCEQDAQQLKVQVLDGLGIGAAGNTTEGIIIDGNKQGC